MKLMSAILAVLMLYLSVMPCDDAKGADNCGAEIHFHADNGHNHDGHSDTDGCSPFCVCQCCHTPVIFSSYHFRSSIIMDVAQQQRGYYQKFIPTSILYAIWHPPKIS